MALGESPGRWQGYINSILSSIPERLKHLVIVDNILLHTSKHGYLKYLEDWLKVLLESVLKYYQRSVNSLELSYNIWVPLVLLKAKEFVLNRSLEAIQNIKAPMIAQDCKLFAGVVNYLSMFCPNLQKFRRPIYDLTRKGTPIIWTNIHQETSEETKMRLLKAPV